MANDIWDFNFFLLKKSSLFLPKIKGDQILVFAVKNKEHLLFNQKFSIFEPDETLCEEVAIKKIDLIITPGIAFDSNGGRLGFGKGYYDRLIAKTASKNIGVGFKEQFCSKLPEEKFDQKMDAIYLF